MARTLGDDLEGDQNVVHVTKGFEIETFSRMSQVLREETCTLKVGVLSGPTVATELAAGQPSGAVLASKFGEVVERTQALFDGTTFRVYGGHDIVGVEVAGAFKELVAVAAGAVDGLGLGQSTKWLVVTRGLREMAALGVAMGADVFTFGGLAGVGELGAACSSDRSLGHRLGRLLAEGNVTVAEALERMPGFVEALPTSEAVQRHSTRFGVDLPIARAVYDLLHGERPVRQCVDDLMSIPVGQEMAALKLS